MSISMDWPPNWFTGQTMTTVAKLPLCMVLFSWRMEGMAKKTVIKRVLKYAPISVDFQKALIADESIKTELSVDMSESRNECLKENAEDNIAA